MHRKQLIWKTEKGCRESGSPATSDSYITDELLANVIELPELFQQFMNIDWEVWINPYRNILFKRVKVVIFLFIFEAENIYNLFCRIYNPVFADTCCAVFKKLDAVISFLSCRRCPLAAAIWKFVFLTDDADIRFCVRFVIFVQKNGERGRIYFAGAMIRFNVIPEKL